MTPVDPSVARGMWHLLEPYHAIVYFAPEVREAMKAVGLKGFWMGYFAGRVAPIGAVGPEVVTATFFGFHPSMPARALPDAWRYASPADVLAARYEAVDAALRRIFGEELGGEGIAEAAVLAREAVAGCELAGRPLFAGHLGLPWPTSSHLALWHAVTLLREHRGDGHVISLAAEGLDGCSAQVAAAETGAVPRDQLQQARGWSDDDWDAARQRLAGVDLVDLRTRVEIRTDRLAVGPWNHLGEATTRRLAALLHPLAERIMTSGDVPVPNPIGVPWPPQPLG